MKPGLANPSLRSTCNAGWTGGPRVDLEEHPGALGPIQRVRTVHLFESLHCLFFHHRDLMAKQDLRELGLGHEAKTESAPRPDESASAQRRREARGFVAGESQKERRAAPGQDLPSFKRGH